MRSKETALAEFPARVADGASTGSFAQLVTVVSLRQDGTPEVKVDANGPCVPARLAMRSPRERLETAITLGQYAVAVFEGGDRSRPILLGFIEPPELPQPASADVGPREAEVKLPTREARLVQLDKRKLEFEASEEIRLTCGKSSLVLRRDGTVVVRGVKIVSRASESNKIRGATVSIN
jgi:hypothetical protein